MEDKFRLLDLPVGTTMYLIQCDRTGEHCCAKVVKYGGYELYSDTRSYNEPGMISPFSYKQDCVRVRFDEVNSNEIKYTKFLLDVYEVKTLTQSTFTGDEHLAHGKADSPYMDVYFTTNKEKANAFVKEHFLKQAEKKRDDLTRQIENVCEFLVLDE